MRKFLVKIAAVAFLAGCCLAVSAQVPSFREKGYKGNVGIHTMLLMPGITTSHGYMFNGTHYLGAGFNAALFDVNPFSMTVSPFIEYQAYFLSRNSTPVAGVRLEGLADIQSHKGYYDLGFSPSFGWSWGIGSRRQFGIMPYIGSSLFFNGGGLDMLNYYLGVVFEF